MNAIAWQEVVIIKRKVILHGPSTLTVSLPSKWVKSNNVKKGDELNVEDAGSLLNVYAGEENLLSKKTKVDFTALSPELINSMLAVLHKSGYDELDITFKGADALRTIQERINSMLLGYEIVDQKGNNCVVRNMAGDHISELDTLIRRVFLVTLSMANSSLSSLEEIRNCEKTGRNKLLNKTSSQDGSAGDGVDPLIKLNELLILEMTNNKLTNYCQRLLNKKPYKDEKTIYTYLIIWVLESICDDYRDLLKYILKNPALLKHPVLLKKSGARDKSSGYAISPLVLELYQKVNKVFEDYYGLFYQYSSDKMIKVRGEISSLRNILLSITVGDIERPICIFLFSIVTRIYNCLGTTSALRYDAKV